MDYDYTNTDITPLEIAMRKDKRNGWSAKTRAVLGTVPADYTGHAGERVLVLTTGKNDRGGIYTTASCVVERETGHGYVSQQYALMADFNKRVAVVTGKATEKAVKQAHQVALGLFPAIIEEAKAFYAAKAAQQPAA